MTGTYLPTSAARDVRVLGIDAAERLLDQVAETPIRARCVGITGPGGSGKSALLAALAESYRQAGIDVVGLDSIGDDEPPTGALFLDDAHLADPVVLVRARRLVTAPGNRVFVAMRPRPRPEELSALVEAIRHRGQVVWLDHLRREAVEQRAAARLEARPSASMVDFLHSETGGLPRLVDDVLDAWRHDLSALDAPVPVVPPRVVERVQRLVEDAGVAVRAVLHAAAIGCELEPEAAAAVLEIEAADAADAIAAARASGLLLPDDKPVPLVVGALLSSTSAELTRSMRIRLLRLRLQQQRSVVPLARALARSGVQDGLVAGVLVAAGDRLRASDPAGALELYTDAVDAGATATSLDLRRAESAARSGRFDLALQLVDGVLGDVDGSNFATGMEIAAAAMAHRGQLSRAGELYEWLGRDRISAGAAMAATALMATGRAGGAALLDTGRPEPTLAGGSRALIAVGLRQSLEGEPATALSTLMQGVALLEAAERSVLLPDTPAGIAALIAIHTGDLDVAESALTRAIDRGLGGEPFWARHRLLLAWVAMLRGRNSQVSRLRAEAVGVADESALTMRDELFVRALDLGVARRTSDAGALVAAWQVGQPVLLRHPVDLFTLLPLGEFAIAAARLRQYERVGAHLDEAWALLHRLGDPHVWTPTLRWCGLQAAILRNHPDEVEPHAAALLQAAHHSPLAAAMAAAGRAWLHALAGDVDPRTVEPAARGLQEFGLAWDGSRLLGQAAALSNDRQASAALLQAARSLQLVDDSASEGNGDHPSSSSGGRATTVLSEREQEVAELLLQRRTYREIGQQLFISPKTVEHHVARIKQRLGATSRADLLARLRAATVAQ